MRGRFHAADVAATAVVLVFVGVFGTGLGLAAAHVRASSPADRTPLRIILRPTNDMPSIQRDRVRLHQPLR